MQKQLEQIGHEDLICLAKGKIAEDHLIDSVLLHILNYCATNKFSALREAHSLLSKMIECCDDDDEKK